MPRKKPDDFFLPCRRHSRLIGSDTVSGEPDLRFPLNLLLARRAAGHRPLKFMIPTLPAPSPSRFKRRRWRRSKVPRRGCQVCRSVVAPGDIGRIEETTFHQPHQSNFEAQCSSRSAIRRCSAAAAACLLYNILVMVMRGSKHD